MCRARLAALTASDEIIAPVTESPQYRLLQTQFSSTVTLKELRSIAEIICTLTGIREPSRDAKRNYTLMLKWYVEKWVDVSPWIPLTHLVDDRGIIVDGYREKVERSFIRL
jgi:hypothetical protein